MLGCWTLGSVPNLLALHERPASRQINAYTYQWRRTCPDLRNTHLSSRDSLATIPCNVKTESSLGDIERQHNITSIMMLNISI